MNVYEVINWLEKLHSDLKECEVMIDIPCIRPGDEGPVGIKIIVIDQTGTEDPIILIEPKD